MSLKLIITIISIVFCSGIVAFIKYKYNKYNAAMSVLKKVDKQMKVKKEIKKEHNNVDKKTEEIKENINTVDNDKLSSSYADKLRDRPRNNRG